MQTLEELLATKNIPADLPRDGEYYSFNLPGDDAKNGFFCAVSSLDSYFLHYGDWRESLKEDGSRGETIRSIHWNSAHDHVFSERFAIASKAKWKETLANYKKIQGTTRAWSQDLPPPETIPTTQTGEHRGLTYQTLKDIYLEAKKPMDWLVEDLLPRDHFACIFAKTKIGKSALARQLTMAVATGTPFMGRPTKQGLVLYLAMEEGAYSTGEHFLDMGAPDTLPILFYPKPLFGADFALLEADIKYLKPRLIILDTLFKAIRIKGGDGNAYNPVQEALEPLIAITRAEKITVFGIHHAVKGERDDIADSGLGSTAIPGATDANWHMRRTKEGKTTLFIRGRLKKQFPETELLWNETNRTYSLGATVSQIKVDAKWGGIATALIKCGGKASLKQLAVICGMRYETVREWSAAKLASGEIEMVLENYQGRQVPKVQIKQLIETEVMGKDSF